MSAFQPGAKVLEELGFEASEEPVSVILRSPDTGVARGFASSTTPGAPHDVLPDLLEGSLLEQIKLPESLDAGLREVLRVARATGRPGLFALDVDGDVRVVGGATQSAGEQGLRVVDARGREVWARVDVGGFSVLLGFLDAAMCLGTPPRRLPDILSTFLDATAVPAPPVEVWLGQGSPRWLRDLVVAGAASPSRIDRACATGLVHRFWVPLPGVSAEEALALALGAEPTPDLAAERWFHDLPRAALDALDRLAVEESERLAERLTGVQDVIAGGTPGGRDEAVAWLHRRDDLEALVEPLRRAGSGRALAKALDALDQHAATFGSIWSVGAGFDDERLCAVAWQHVEAWWGRLAG